MVIDRSGSMGSMTITPDNRDVRGHPKFDGDLDNVLGVVYEAAYKYMTVRSARAPNDLLSFIPFNDRAELRFTSLPIDDVDYLLGEMLDVAPDGGTCFDSALLVGHEAVQKVRIPRILTKTRK
jgi:hypothetical protein